MHENVKRQIVTNTERDTTLIFREFRNTARVTRNAVSEEINRIAATEAATFDDFAHLASGARGRERVLAGGDVEGGCGGPVRRRA